MAEEKSKEQREQKWCAAWRKEDFSWQGLANKLVGQTHDMMHRQSEHGPLGLNGEKLLQDYWRRDPDTGMVRDDAALFAAGELIKAPNGDAWYIVHTPLYWQNGKPAKAAWDEVARNKLATCIPARIAAGAETKVDRYGERGAEGPDGRAQLAGAVLLDPPTNPDGKSSPMHLDALAAWFPDWDASDQAFGPGVRFDRAFFSKGAYFFRATFLGVARFEMATFCDTAYGSPRFEAAAFSGYVTFYHAAFCGGVGFTYAKFYQGARIESANFFGDASFTGATFSGEVDLGSTFSGETSFRGATFMDKADFLTSHFSKDASFDGATFSGDVTFYKPSFSVKASFDGASFSRDVRFKMATFSGDASFEGGRCEKTVRFDGTRFEKKACFSTREFAGFVYFDGAHFAGPMLFGAAVFEKLVSFRQITWPDAARDWHAAFNQVLFRGTAVFKGSKFKALAAFDGATFERGIQIDDVSEAIAGATFEAECRGAITGAAADANEWRIAEEKRRKEADNDSAKPITGHEISVRKAQARELRLKELERGCRVLKQAMEKASNKTREQLLYRFELIARRSQRDTPVWERLFSYLYQWTSNYGGSIARPLGALLFVLVPGFTAFYWGWAAVLDRVYPTQAIGSSPMTDAWAALRFAWTNVFQPFSVLANNIVTAGNSSWLAAFLNDFGPGWGFAVRVVATLQSVTSLILIFLAGLAVRRRFQIS